MFIVVLLLALSAPPLDSHPPEWLQTITERDARRFFADANSEGWSLAFSAWQSDHHLSNDDMVSFVVRAHELVNVTHEIAAPPASAKTDACFCNGLRSVCWRGIAKAREDQ